MKNLRIGRIPSCIGDSSISAKVCGGTDPHQQHLTSLTHCHIFLPQSRFLMASQTYPPNVPLISPAMKILFLRGVSCGAGGGGRYGRLISHEVELRRPGKTTQLELRLATMLGKSSKMFSRMVVQKGDESHGTNFPSKKSPYINNPRNLDSGIPFFQP